MSNPAKILDELSKMDITPEQFQIMCELAQDLGLVIPDESANQQ